MYENLRGKKLLLLGGVLKMADAVKVAKFMGAEVYVTDYLEDSPCKKIADKSFMISATDVDAVVDLINKEKIDGVITGFVDSLLPSYVDICNKAGLPCYANEKCLGILLNKRKIKEACIEFGIPVPYMYTQEEIDNDEVNYPVIVKPVDGSGSRGCTVCDNKEQLYSAIGYALSYSKVGEYIVEEYMTGDTVSQLFFMQDGELVTMCLSDIQTVQYYEDKPKIGICQLQPSIHTKRFMSDLYPKYCALFDALSLSNGPIQIDSYVKDGNLFWGDIGYRLTGDLVSKLADEAFGVDFYALLISFALTGKVSTKRIKEQCDPLLNGRCAAQIKYAIRPGKVDKIVGIDTLKNMDDIFYSDIYIDEGFELKEEDRGKLVQVVGRAHILTNSIEQLEECMYKAFNCIDFLDEEGNTLKMNLSQYRECLNLYRNRLAKGGVYSIALLYFALPIDRRCVA